MKLNYSLRSTVVALAMTTLPSFAQSLTDPVPDKSDSGQIELTDKDALDESSVKLDDAIPKLPPAAAAMPVKQAAPDTGIPALNNLSQEKRNRVGKAVGDVSNFMRGVRLQEALEKLNEIEGITGDFFLVENMRGAVYTKMRDFKAARSHFEKAIELTKSLPSEQFHPKFNLAEIDFVEKKFEAAKKGFGSLLEDPSAKQGGTRQLMLFKQLVCDLKLKENVEKQLAAFDPYDFDSPAYYFSKAAMAFEKDDKEDAEEWLASANKIYPKEVNDIYQDSLVEMGWLQTLQ